MSSIRDLPEIAGLSTNRGLVRIPPELDVPVTPRVRQLIDTSEFRRLGRIRQLGLVSLVYPAAHHTRMEHSLGVYRMALLTLHRLAADPRFTEVVEPADAELFLIASLLHDLGHWPFCHPIEDLQLPSVPTHELFANSFLLEGELADTLRDDWGVNPRQVIEVLSGKPRSRKMRLLRSILSGPIDIDKMDYLVRDSLHAGVPYGRHFDQSRLIRNLCLNHQGDGLAITDKGKTAAEMMVFARYVMFSEVYWHHAVRSATAMLQRSFYQLHHALDLDVLFRLTEESMIAELVRAAHRAPAEELLGGLFGPIRKLYKRLVQLSIYQHPELYKQLARKPYPWLVACAEQLASAASQSLGQVVAPHEILIDAPPVAREVDVNISVYFPHEDRFRQLEEISPLVKTLARQQFDDYVKRVRIFVHPRIADDMRGVDGLTDLVQQAIDRTEG